MVSVLIVTWNSAQFLPDCFASIDQQDYQDLEVVVVDNASSDETRQLLRLREASWRVTYNTGNLGFAAGQNQAIRASHGDWLLCLNPDMMLAPDFIRRLVEAGEDHPEAGSICGKLLRWDVGGNPSQTRVIDSTGIYFNPMLRHLDRGSQEVDNGHYLQYEYVFGATAAAALYSRAMIDDISLDGEFFDTDFFVPPRPRIFGHRGAAGEFPENTMVSFERAVRAGAIYLELDVHMSRDGEIVVSHDEGLTRTCGRDALIREMNWAEIEDADAGHMLTFDGGATFPFRGGYIKIPRLIEVLGAFLNVNYLIEIKQTEPSLVSQLLAIVDASGGLIMFQKLDDTQNGSIAVSQGKARTAALFKRPSRLLEEMIAQGKTALLSVEGIVPLQGGVPVTVDGKVIGAVGVSGVTSAQDEQVAMAAVGALG